MIIQARIGSTRLPAKTMLDMAGKPLVYRICERVLKCKSLDEVIVAIPETSENDILERSLKELPVKTFRGDESNLMNRYLRCATEFRIENIVRLPADNPMPDHRLIDYLVDWHFAHNPEGFTSNLSSVLNNGMIDGVGAEIFPLHKLEGSFHRSPTPDMCEHIHLNFYDYAAIKERDAKFCRVMAPPVQKKFQRPEIILDINSLEEYVAMNKVFVSLFDKDPDFTTDEILNLFSGEYNK